MLGHAGFDLRDSAGDVVGKVLTAIVCHQDYILDADSADFSLVLPDFFTIEIAQIELEEVSWDLTVEQEVSEVQTGFNCDKICLINDAGGAHVCQAWERATLWRVVQVAANVMTVKSNEVTETVRHEDEADTLLHHLVDVSSEAAKFYKALQDAPLSELVAFDPVDTGSQHCEDGPRRSQHNVVNLSLLLSEHTIDGERNGDIRTVVVERVTLVSQHGLSIDQGPVVVLVMEGCSGWATPTDGQVRLNTPNVVILLTAEDKEAFELAFAHARLAVLQNVHVGL